MYILYYYYNGIITNRDIHEWTSPKLFTELYAIWTYSLGVNT